MAIYHLSVKPVCRGGGRSATAAAYRAGGRVCDQTSGETHDYTRRRVVAGVGIVLPAGAARRDAQWAQDREALWNAAERAEHRSSARVAREYELALPHELSRVERLELVRSFAAWIADRYRVAVDFALHAPHRAGDERNHHAHLLATTRVIEPGGFGEKAPIEWSDANRRKAGLGPAREEVLAVRAHWASLVNGKLRWPRGWSGSRVHISGRRCRGWSGGGSRARSGSGSCARCSRPCSGSSSGRPRSGGSSGRRGCWRLRSSTYPAISRRRSARGSGYAPDRRRAVSRSASGAIRSRSGVGTGTGRNPDERSHISCCTLLIPLEKAAS